MSPTSKLGYAVSPRQLRQITESEMLRSMCIQRYPPLGDVVVRRELFLINRICWRMRLTFWKLLADVIT